MLPTKKSQWAVMEDWQVSHGQETVMFWDGEHCRGRSVSKELRHRPCKKCVLALPPYEQDGQTDEREVHTTWYHADGSIEEEITRECWCDQLEAGGCQRFSPIPHLVRMTPATGTEEGDDD